MVAHRAKPAKNDVDFDHSSSTFAMQRDLRWNLRAYHCAGRDGDEVIQVDPIGTAAETRQLINSYADVVWRGGSWGVYMGDGFYIEFDVGLTEGGSDDEMLEYFGVAVMGDGDASAFLNEFATVCELVFCDADSGEVVDEFSALERLVDTDLPTTSYAATRAEFDRRNTHSLDGLEFDDIWVNLKAEQNNFIALNGDAVLIATTSIEDLYRLIDEYDANQKITLQSRMLWTGSHCYELASVTEIVEDAESSVCQISFSGMSWPVEVVFGSRQERSEFMDVILTRVSAVNHVVPERSGFGAAEVLLLVLALTSAVIGMVDGSLWVVLASLAVFFFVVASLMRSGSKRSRMKTVYRFSH